MRRSCQNVLISLAGVFLAIAMYPAFAFGQNDVVEKLVCRNATPSLNGSKKVIFPARFDWPEYERCHKYFRHLSENMDLDSFWKCVDGMDNTSYCTTLSVNDGGGVRNFTVGEACLLLVSSSISDGFLRVEVTNTKLFYKLEGCIYGSATEEKKIEKIKLWLEGRKKLELFQIQAEACDFAVAYLREDPEMKMASDWIPQIQRRKDFLVSQREHFMPNFFRTERFSRLFEPKED